MLKIDSKTVKEKFIKEINKNPGYSMEKLWEILESTIFEDFPKEQYLIIQEFLSKQSKLKNKIERMITLFPSEKGKEHFTHAILTEILFDISELI